MRVYIAKNAHISSINTYRNWHGWNTIKCNCYIVNCDFLTILEIEGFMPILEEMPVRKIGVKGKGVTGRFFSFKMGRIIECESRLEKDFCYILEFDSRVFRYEEQPETFYIEDFKYTPDFRVDYIDGVTEFVEVKPSCMLSEYRKKFKLIDSYLRKDGFKFQMWTEQDVSPIYMDNLKFLYRYIKQPVGYRIYVEGVLSIIKKAERTRIKDVIAAFRERERAYVLPVIWHMIAKNVIRADFNKPLTNSCEVFYAGV